MTGVAVRADATFEQQLRERLQERINKRNELRTQVEQLLEAPTAEKRDLNQDESTRFAELRDQLQVLDLTDATAERYADSIDALSKRVAELAEISKRTTETAQVTTTSAVRVRSEERTYSKAAERRGQSFLRDVVNAQLRGDWKAQQRLDRHMQEERVERGDYIEGLEQRAVGTDNFAGITVPQYLTDMVAMPIRAMRPFADVCRKHDLPPTGMTAEISRITTGSTAAAQATQNSAVSETNMDDTLLSVPIRTVAGQQTVARQAIDRSSGADDVVVADLIAAYHSELDRQILVAAGTSGTHTGIKSVSGNVAVTYTDATPTAAELHPKLADLIQQIQAGTPVGLTHFIMHPRRWWWYASQLSSTFPLLGVPGGGTQQVGELGDTGYQSALPRTLLGPPVVLDRNVETTLGAGTEDAIYGVDATECHLWEDPGAPLMIRAEQTAAATLGVLFVIYGYSAFTAGRYPGATGDITGTGLIAPTF